MKLSDSIGFLQTVNLTSACTRPPTALFLRGYAPAKALVIEVCLAGPVSGDARRWAAKAKSRMTSRIVNLKEEAEVLRNCLELDLISVFEAIEWADKYIEQTSEPEFAMIEVALARRKRADDVARILADIKGIVDEKQVMKRVFGVMKILFESDPAQDTKIARALFKMAQAEEIPSKEAEAYMFWFDDALDLARLGYGSENIEQVHNKLRDFLKIESAI